MVDTDGRYHSAYSRGLRYLAVLAIRKAQGTASQSARQGFRSLVEPSQGYVMVLGGYENGGRHGNIATSDPPLRTPDVQGNHISLLAIRPSMPAYRECI